MGSEKDGENFSCIGFDWVSSVAYGGCCDGASTATATENCSAMCVVSNLIIDGTIPQAGADALIEHAGFGYPTYALG